MQDKLKLLSLFSGIGGMDKGLEAAGFEVVAHSEIEAYPCEVLARHWPDVPNLGDVTQIDFAQTGPVDVICGGFPCQDVSLAGRGEGIKHGTRSGLWFEFLRAIRVLRPRGAIVENVAGLFSSNDGRDFGTVLGSLAEERYDAEWGCVSAADVGAPHGRRRVFILAHEPECAPGHTQGIRVEGLRPSGEQELQASTEEGLPRCASGRPDGVGLADAISSGRKRRSRHEREAQGRGESAHGSVELDNAHSSGCSGRSCSGSPEQAGHGSQDGIPEPGSRDVSREPTVGLADSSCVDGGSGAQQHQRSGSGARYASGRILQPIPASDFWQDWEPVSAVRRTADGSEELVTRLVPPGVPLLETGQKRRKEKIKALGNAVVPQVAEYIGRCFYDFLTGGQHAS